MRMTDADERLWLTKSSCIARNYCVDSAIEMFLESMQLFRMIYFAFTNHVQYIEFRRERLSECHRERGSVRCFDRTVCCVENALDKQSCGMKNVDVRSDG